VFANLFQINVWVRDNIRIFYCWHFIASASVSYSLFRIVSQSRNADNAAVIRDVAVDEKKDLGNEPTSDDKRQEERDENVFLYLKWIVVFLLVVLLITTGNSLCCNAYTFFIKKQNRTTSDCSRT